MAGPWERYQTQTQEPAQSKPWERYAAAAAPQDNAQKAESQPATVAGTMKGITTGLGAALAGAAQGIPFAKDISAGLGAAIATPFTDKTYGENFSAAREQLAEKDKIASDKYPLAYYPAAIATSIGAGNTALKALGAAAGTSKIASGAQKLIQANPVKASSLAGAVYGAGMGDTGGQRLQDAALGAAIPFGLSGAAKAIPAIDRALGTTIRPTAQMLKKASQESYKKLAKYGGDILPPSAPDSFLNHAESFKPKGEWAAAVRGKEDAFDKWVSNVQYMRGKPMSLDDAMNIDKEITDKLNSSDFSENGILNAAGHKLVSMKAQLRQTLMDAAEGHPMGETYLSAVKDWSAKSQMNEIEKIIESGKYYQNSATNMQAGFRNIAKNPERLGMFNPEAQELIKKAASDKSFVNALKSTAGSRLLGSMLGAAAGSIGGPIGSAAGGIAGLVTSGIARDAAEKAYISRANKIADAIAQGSSIPTTNIPLSAKLSNILKRSPKEIEQAVEPQRLLPAPNTVYVPTGKGQFRPQTASEMNTASQQSKELNDLGMTGDIRAIVLQKEIRKKYGPVWDAIDNENKKRIAQQIEDAFSSQKKPIDEIISDVMEGRRLLEKEAGIKTPIGSVGYALLNAKQKPSALARAITLNAAQNGK